MSKRMFGMTLEEMTLWFAGLSQHQVRQQMPKTWSAWPRPAATSNSRRFGAALARAEQQLSRQSPMSAVGQAPT